MHLSQYCWKKGLKLDALSHSEFREDEYKKALKQAQLELLTRQRSLAEAKRSLLVVFEGPDAAGKGGAIRRMVERLDPRLLRVHSVIKPTEEEYGHHYLWRFWNKLPRYGQLAVFDRSWYGRVLVERVEGFASEAQWKRAYHEINQFEELLLADGAIVVKIYMHISKEEQLSRFKRREADPYKHWKITDEDWRNRRKWDQHNEAAEEMFQKTGATAPWTVLPSNFKWFARVNVVQTVNAALEAAGIAD
ncbi:MAG: PPK2 family [Verrucomicrobia bacterium]|nr:MAG: PPK2 family [Verrucomicrobiota bacterium]